MVIGWKRYWSSLLLHIYELLEMTATLDSTTNRVYVLFEADCCRYCSRAVTAGVLSLVRHTLIKHRKLSRKFCTSSVHCIHATENNTCSDTFKVTIALITDWEYLIIEQITKQKQKLNKTVWKVMTVTISRTIVCEGQNIVDNHSNEKSNPLNNNKKNNNNNNI